MNGIATSIGMTGATAMIMACSALLLTLALRRAVVERLSIALLVGLAAGLIALAATPRTPQAADALRLAVLGMACGALAHGFFQVLRAGTTNEAEFTLRRVDADALRWWAAPVGHAMNRFAERHPARLIRAYRSFHLLVSLLFAALWLAALWAFGTWLDSAEAQAWLGGHAPAGQAAAMAAATLFSIAAAFAAWWLSAGLCLAIAVRSDTLPPFGVRPYWRNGRFPSHWLAKVYRRDA